MHERPLDSAVHIMPRYVVKSPVTQVHAQPLHVRDFYQVRILARVFHPLLGGGTEPQRLFRLLGFKGYVCLVGKAKGSPP